MAGRVTLRFQKSNALAFPKKTTACNSKDQAKRTILRSVRSQGHIYVELREDGKKSFFFCTLCLAPCYSDSVLFDHLNGSLHNERFLTAKVTLLGPNPWPFNDGVVFFSNPIEDEEETVASNGKQRRLPESHENGHSLAIIAYDGQVNEVDDQNEDQNEDLQSVEESDAVVIPGVRVGSEVTNLKAKELGYGLLSARFRDNDISRIWCEWLGERTVEDDEEFSMVPEHDFAVVTFSYNDFNLGRVGFLDDVKSLLCSSPTTETQNGEGSNSKRTKLLSDPKDAIEGSDSHYDSAGDDSSVSTTSSLMLHQYDSQLLDSRFISSKAMRREMRRKQRIAAERMCDICQHKMLPGKDVATLMNVKNGKLACSSRNGNGAFHLFHTSCVIHWVLLCEAETISKQPEVPKAKRRSRRKTASKSNEVRNEVAINPLWTPIGGVICPECQGTGTVVDGDDEKPSVPLSKMFKYKIKVSDARREWMKSPESLKNCSTGFCFPTQSGENIQEKVKPLKLLRFYGVREV